MKSASLLTSKPSGRKLRVLMVGPEPSMPGGMSSCVRDTLGYLSTQDDIDVTLFNETKIKGRSGLETGGALKSSLESLRSLAAFVKRLPQENPDVLHLHTSYGTSVLEKTAMAWLASKRGIPSIVHFHGSKLDRELMSLPNWKRNWLNATIGKPNQAIVLTGLIQQLMSKAAPQIGTTVLPNSVNIVDPPAPLTFSPFTIGFIGALNGRKGELDLIRALSLSKAKESAQIVIAGDGSGRAAAELLAKELGVQDRIEFLGNISGDAKDKFFRRIDLLALPSHAENLPIALLEGMSYGRAVIATPVGGVADLVKHGINGWMTPPQDPNALALVLDEVASNYSEIEKRAGVAWETIREGYTWERNGPTLVSLYYKVAEIARETVERVAEPAS